MDQHTLPDEITTLLCQMDKEELPPEQDEPPMEEPVAAKTIHIYIRDEPEEPEEEEATVESTLEDRSSHSEQEQDLSTMPLVEKQSKKPLAMVLASLLCVLALTSVLLWYLLPFWMPTATVTIVPVSQRISTTQTVLVRTEQHTPAAEEIPGRTLATITMSQARTITTTGRAHQEAQTAHGSITFYNALPQIQTVVAGQLLTTANGLQVVTDQDAVLPAAMMPTEGQVTVPAHALQAGPQGNITAGSIYGACCRADIFVSNGAFSGGQEARDYPTATQQDLSIGLSSLKGSLDQSVQAALQTQVHADETLLTPVTCQQSSKPDHQAGEEASQVHLTMSETCRGVAYNSQAYQDMTTQLLTQEALNHLGEADYTPTGIVQRSILSVTPNEHGSIALRIKLVGTWVYHFSQEQQEHMKALIAGKSKAEAISRLVQVPGVQSAAISMKNHGEKLPTENKDIDLTLLMPM